MTTLSHLWGKDWVERHKETRGPCGKGCLCSLARSKHGYHISPMGQTQSPAAPPAEGSAFWGSPTAPQSGLRPPPPPPAPRRWQPPSRAAERATLSTTWLGECPNLQLTKRQEKATRRSEVRGGGNEEGG